MNMISEKNIVLCVSGSIAAYKSAFLTRLLIKEGCNVKILMTPSSTDFISPLTLSTLSKNPVHLEVNDGENWNNHVELGLWADAFLVAPATATTIAKMATGIADNMVVATYLSAKCPTFIAPAMDLDMWKHPSTKRNIELLKSYDNHIIPVGDGELASGLSGEGRMAEPEDICSYLNRFFAKKKDLINKKVIVTAGPTYESLDPVRFLGNHSTGKMGVCIAKECADRGANVTLILGPSKLKVEHTSIEVVRVQSASDMYKATEQYYESCDIAVMAAAVADFRPAEKAEDKIKKTGEDMMVRLVRTKDIAGTLGLRKKDHQLMIGFALETKDEKINASRKLQKKNFDFIVLNSLNDKGAGFQVDTNKVTIFHKDGRALEYGLKSKADVAVDIVDNIVDILPKR